MASPLKVLFVASECAPFAKAGGLGDVVGALPKALAALGHDVRVLIPRYDTIRASTVRHAAPMAIPMGGGELWCAVEETRLPDSDVPVYMLDHRELFARGYIYDPPNGFSPDNLLRFAALSRGAFWLGRHLGWVPDVFHAHDWPTAAIAMYANTIERDTPFGRAATVLTIHNMAHQGIFPASQLGMTHLPSWLMRSDGLETHGALGLLKGGLFHSTMITTVSPTYAREIRTRQGGFGLEHVVNFRGNDLVGVLNGIDDGIWNPRTDPALPAHFDADDLSGKLECKRALQRELHLDVRDDVPLVAVVSRLNDQKGTDIIAECVGPLLSLGIQLVVLGSGDSQSEATFAAWSHQSGGRMRAWLGFREDLAHRIEAAADLFLMPSRFEPCGLNQLYSQRYGTLPIVRATGGLEDTVAQYDGMGGGTGFKFDHLSHRSLVETVRWAVRVWREQPEHIRAMQQRAMRKPMGWDLSAKQYDQVYRWSLERRRGGV
ncbi:MAG: glycogen synthase GlgA [Deltaproteobacteria bacterium]|nr:glycogen synthase GlgA [Deltaproteobacteria bacterium]